MLPDITKFLEEKRQMLSRLDLAELVEIPPMSWYNSYIQRTLEGGVKDMEVFARACRLQLWTLLYGPTGAGKTLVGRALAARERRRYASINFHAGVTSDALIGRWIPQSPDIPSISALRKHFDEDSNLVNAYIHKYKVNYKWVDGRLTEFFRNGGVLDLAEINMAPPAITAFLFQMLDDRRQIVLEDKDGEVIHAHEDFWLIANYNEGYAGTEDLNDALLSRFPVKFFWDNSKDVESAMGLETLATTIGHKLRESKEVRRDIGTRDIRDFSNNIRIFGRDLAGEMFVNGFDELERKPVREAIKMEFSAAAQKDRDAAAANSPAWASGLGASNYSNSPVPVI